MTSIGPTTRSRATGAAAPGCCSRGRRSLGPPQASPSGRPLALPLPAVAGSSMIAVLFSVAMVPRPQELRDQTSQDNPTRQGRGLSRRQICRRRTADAPWQVARRRGTKRPRHSHVLICGGGTLAAGNTPGPSRVLRAWASGPPRGGYVEQKGRLVSSTPCGLGLPKYRRRIGLASWQPSAVP